ncbi:MAG: hypothetical protein BAJALOKI3v1_450028 [Promethearchaeota archaeon]|jgi:uncharacterized protein (DUF169 family)|nr:MAG: hypothetical protein BAJALOKI3v1_450028 [Candidatus Lokiarchaeota archaeon]
MNKFKELKTKLDLKYSPVGFKLIFQRNYRKEIESKFNEPAERLRFCTYIKKAGEGKALRLREIDSSCIITEKKSDIPQSPQLELNIELNFRGLKYFLMFPMDSYSNEDYDGFIMIINPEKAMKVIEAYTELFNKPLKLICGVRSGVCSEITAYVAKREDVNFSFLCSGSRKFAGYGECELLCGIPAKMADELIGKLIA